MIQNNTSFEGKIILLGDSSVGKTAILECFTQGYANKNQTSTVGINFIKNKLIQLKGVDFRTTDIIYDDKQIKLKIWDTSGQERFRSMAKSFYQGAQGIILVFDVSNPESFKQINMWVESIKENNPQGDHCKVLVGNKKDLKNEILQADIDNICEKYNMKYFETSAKQNTGVNEVFAHVAQLLCDKFICNIQQLSNNNLQSCVSHKLSVKQSDQNNFSDENQDKDNKTKKSKCC